MKHRLNRLALLASLLLFAGCEQLLPPLPPSPVDPIVDPVVPPVPVATGFRVLIVEEGSQRASISRGQLEAISSAQFRKWLSDRSAELRVWDKDTDVSRESAEWRALFDVNRTSLPWIVIQGKTSFSGPLPQNLAETEAAIERCKP